MIGPEVQKAVFDALTATPAIAGGNVFDRVPPDAPFPRVTIGDEQVVDAGNSCSDGWEVFCDIHVWSRAVGRVECKELMAEAAERLSAIETITGFDLVLSDLDGTRMFIEPDGLTSHGVITIRFVIDPA